MSDLVTLRRKQTSGRIDRGVATTRTIDKLLAAGAPVAIGVSGGKDSCAGALATIAHLDAIGHSGPRILVHSDLGRVEWRASLPTCERLATALGLELVVVWRTAGDMMDRWLKRWANNVVRYQRLECVKLILPWSTPSMRFCTSELKTAVICRDLKQRFVGTIISASGIRRDESSNRKKAPIAKVQKKLASPKTSGIDWNPILRWSEADVFTYLAHHKFELHEAYTTFGMSRVSCAFCIMGSGADLVASATCQDNVAIYREMVDLEIVSSFAFQGSKWLGDVAPHLLTAAQKIGLALAKERAARRRAFESRIPAHLRYTKDWPTVMPTRAEAAVIAEVRRDVAAELGIEIECADARSVLERYTVAFAKARTKREARDA